MIYNICVCKCNWNKNGGEIRNVQHEVKVGIGIFVETTKLNDCIHYFLPLNFAQRLLSCVDVISLLLLPFSMSLSSCFFYVFHVFFTFFDSLIVAAVVSLPSLSFSLSFRSSVFVLLDVLVLCSLDIYCIMFISYLFSSYFRCFQCYFENIVTLPVLHFDIYISSNSVCF